MAVLAAAARAPLPAAASGAVALSDGAERPTPISSAWIVVAPLSLLFLAMDRVS